MKSFIAFATFWLAVSTAWVVPPAFIDPNLVPDFDPENFPPLPEGIVPVPVDEPAESSPISVGPEIIDFPVPDGGAVTAEEPAVVPSPAVVAPSPVVIGEIPAGSSPLVQIIVNVNAAESAAVAPTPADNAVVDEVYVPGPVNVVDNVYAPDVILEPMQVVEPIVPGPVNVVDNVVVEPIQIFEPIVIGAPIVPAGVLPEILN